jgi:hypothetical protein
MAGDEAAADRADGDGRPVDPFVELLLWLVARNGSVHFTSETGVDVVSATTIRRWLRGDYPKTRVEDSVGQVDMWARQKFRSEYPPEGARGGFGTTAGRNVRPRPRHPRATRSWSRRLRPTSIMTPSTRRRGRTSPTLQTDPDASATRRDAGHQRAPRRHWKLVLASAVAVALVTTAAIGATALRGHRDPPPGATSVLYARDDAPIPVRICPNTTCRTTTLPTGTRVQMICYRDAQRLDLNYSSTRWFDIRDPSNGVTGWVHSGLSEQRCNWSRHAS